MGIWVLCKTRSCQLIYSPWATLAVVSCHGQCHVSILFLPPSVYQSVQDINRADSWLAPSQWEMMLQSNAVSHWLGANLESDLYQHSTAHNISCILFIFHTLMAGPTRKLNPIDYDWAITYNVCCLKASIWHSSSHNTSSYLVHRLALNTNNHGWAATNLAFFVWVLWYLLTYCL